VIRIKDTGMGISAEDQQKLFAPFARVGGVEKTSITGSGLGMWITKQLVEALKGSISVESIKNVGTHVVVTLKR
jgi:two-component system sensor histidine kinase EvgS